MSNKKNPRRKGQKIRSHVNRRLERLKVILARRRAKQQDHQFTKRASLPSGSAPSGAADRLSLSDSHWIFERIRRTHGFE